MVREVDVTAKSMFLPKAPDLAWNDIHFRVRLFADLQ